MNVGSKRGLWKALSDRAAAVFGVSPADRSDTVYAMLAEVPRSAAAYWLQLLLAMGIATLGLVLGSTAVVIGAMLVSPLMTPILALGMGLAVGSPLLVVRSFARVTASIAVVASSAAGIVLLLPIHEVTAEISARTAPNVLDLGVASCCAMAGVYATIRSGKDAATTAAGTAIGISLVPPLCVVGFGVGTRDAAIASGAGLLFTANFCAILLFSVLGFIALGYGRIDVVALEARHVSETPPSGLMIALARRTSAFFASRFGPALRIVMPIALVASVSWPLRAAMGEVSWEVRVRGAAKSALDELEVPPVQSTLRLDRKKVSLSVVMIATQSRAEETRRTLVERLRRAAGTEPRVEVHAVADARALAEAESDLRAAGARVPPTSIGPPAPESSKAGAARDEVVAALASWPAGAAGELLAFRVDVGTEPSRVELVHMGEPIGGAAEELLAKALGAALGERVEIVDVALPRAPLKASPGEERAWIADVASLATTVRLVGKARASVCVTVPESGPLADVESVLRAPVFEHVRIARGGTTLEARVAEGACPEVAPGDAGAPDAAY